MAQAIRSYKVFENAILRDFCSLLGSTPMGAKYMKLLWKLINEQTLLGIMSQMPLAV
jgi:hypothetical protein